MFLFFFFYMGCHRPILCIRPSYRHTDFNETIMQLIHVDGATLPLSTPLHDLSTPLVSDKPCQDVT